jgi:hypothetical protein
MTHANSNINCDQFADGLSDLLERDVDEMTRTRLESHALACAECGPLLADLRRLRIDAATLPVLEPSRVLWSGIAARIETPVVEITAGRGERVVAGAPERSSAGTPERRNARALERRRVSPLWIGLAAAGLVAFTATVTYEVTKSRIDVRSPATGATVAPVAAAPSPAAITATAGVSHDSSAPALPRSSAPAVTLASVKPSAEQAYDLEIRRLQAIVVARRAQLDTATVSVVEKNLKVIDEAIAQCKAALQRDPASRFLIESLNDALDSKVQLLRTAAQLAPRS